MSISDLLVYFCYGDYPRYYAWDYRVLRTFAKHYSTGEVIPEKLVELMKGAKKMFAATDLQRQVFCLKLSSMYFLYVYIRSMRI